MVPIVIVDHKRLLNSSIPNLGSADSWSMAKTAGGWEGKGFLKLDGKKDYLHFH